MKVTVDIDKLLQEGRISSAEHARLKSSAAADTGSLALNLLLGFGVIATAAGSGPHGRTDAWVVNLVVVFGAIHFYTQYFERLGASPGTVLTAGLIAIGIALALFRHNRGDAISRPPSPATSN